MAAMAVETAFARTEPDVVDYPCEVPPDVQKRFVSMANQYIALLPKTQRTVWLSAFSPLMIPNARMLRSRGGTTMLSQMDLNDINKAQPVLLFAKPVCMAFAQKHRCEIKDCPGMHCREDQIKQLIACRHVQLQDLSPKQRREMYNHIIEEEGGLGIENVLSDVASASMAFQSTAYNQAIQIAVKNRQGRVEDKKKKKKEKRRRARSTSSDSGSDAGEPSGDGPKAHTAEAVLKRQLAEIKAANAAAAAAAAPASSAATAPADPAASTAEGAEPAPDAVAGAPAPAEEEDEETRRMRRAEREAAAARERAEAKVRVLTALMHGTPEHIVAHAKEILSAHANAGVSSSSGRANGGAGGGGGGAYGGGPRGYDRGYDRGDRGYDRGERGYDRYDRGGDRYERGGDRYGDRGYGGHHHHHHHHHAHGYGGGAEGHFHQQQQHHHHHHHHMGYHQGYQQPQYGHGYGAGY